MKKTILQLLGLAAMLALAGCASTETPLSPRIKLAAMDVPPVQLGHTLTIGLTGDFDLTKDAREVVHTNGWHEDWTIYDTTNGVQVAAFKDCEIYSGNIVTWESTNVFSITVPNESD